LLTSSIRKISQKLGLSCKFVTDLKLSFVIHRPTLQSPSARQYHALMKAAGLALRGSSVEFSV